MHSNDYSRPRRGGGRWDVTTVETPHKASHLPQGMANVSAGLLHATDLEALATQRSVNNEAVEGILGYSKGIDAYRLGRLAAFHRDRSGALCSTSRQVRIFDRKRDHPAAVCR